jgi:two-component system KDP operon response regulator KdpE
MPTSDGLAQPLNILLVEPNPDVQEAFAALLSCVGYAVEVAAQGSEALAIAARNPPDIVLLELALKDMRGVDLCAALRSRAGTKQCAIVAVTSYCNDEHKREMLDAGADLVLLKPVSLKDIMAACRPMSLTA